MIQAAQNPQLDHVRVKLNCDRELKSIEKEYQNDLKFAKQEKNYSMRIHTARIGRDRKYYHGYNREEKDEKLK